MQCPYYGGVEKRGKDSGIRCTKDFLFMMSDEMIQQTLDIKCVGDTERDQCRPFLYHQCEELKLIETPFHGSTEELRKLYLEKISESGTTPPKEEKNLCKKCGSCNIGHWYSGENTYTNVVQNDGEHTIQRPCKPHTHYCYQFDDGQRKIADDANFNPDSAPDWCPRLKPDDLIYKADDETDNDDDENTVLQSTATEAEEQSMSETMEKVAEQAAEVSSRHQYAEKLHNQIMYNAEMVASYLVELCKNLKRMKDEALYTELGFDTFDDYIEKDVGIKKRQAYTYISTYERLGDTFVQSNARLGITKLSMLTEVPAVDRPDFAEDNDLEAMSTREIKELVEKSKQQGEQLSLLTDERDKAKTESENSLEEADKACEAKKAAEDALKEAQNRIAELEKAEPDAAALEKLRKEAEKKVKKEYADKLKTEKDKAAADALKESEDKIKAARKEGEKAAEERIKSSLEAAEQEKAELLNRAAELEKQLKVTGNKDMALFAYLYDEFQQNFNKLCGLVKKMDAADAETAAKLRSAVQAAAEKQAQDAKLI